MTDQRRTKSSRHRNRTGKTDWEWVRSLRGDEVEDDARTDDQRKDLPGANWPDAELVAPRTKKAVSIRLDEDVIAFFKAGGHGYQTRINQVLRSYMEHQVKKRK